MPLMPPDRTIDATVTNYIQDEGLIKGIHQFGSNQIDQLAMCSTTLCSSTIVISKETYWLLQTRKRLIT